MAMGKEIGEFSCKVVSVTYADEGLGTSINFDGTASGFGTVLGPTVFSASGPGATSGTCSYTGEGFLDDGSVIGGKGQVVWQTSGKHQWRIRSIVLLSNGGSGDRRRRTRPRLPHIQGQDVQLRLTGEEGRAPWPVAEVRAKPA